HQWAEPAEECREHSRLHCTARRRRQLGNSAAWFEAFLVEMGDTGAEKMNSENLREDGNKHFKSGDYEAAILCYTKAIKISTDTQDKAVVHRNRAACYLKLENYTKAEEDASKAIEVDGGDVKSSVQA
ncbi:unnamed protein product, partial [Staurois parvus]